MSCEAVPILGDLSSGQGCASISWHLQMCHPLGVTNDRPSSHAQVQLGEILNIRMNIRMGFLLICKLRQNSKYKSSC